MQIFRLLLPYVLAAYFVARAFKQRIFLLGLPFLSFLGVGLFFDRAKLFHTPGSWNGELVLLLWVALAWFFAAKFSGLRERRSVASEVTEGGSRLTWSDAPLILLLLILLYNITKNIIEYKDAATTFDVAFGPLALLVGYFLMKGIFSHSSRGDIIAFFDAVILANTLAAVFYLIHQGLHIPIYLDEEYFAQSYRGVLITRTFWFMPLLMPLSVAFQLARERQTWKSITIAGINAVAIVITYTRSLVIILVLMALVVYALQGVRAGRLRLILKRYFALACVGGVFVLFFALVFPVQAQFFIDRVAPLLSDTRNQRSNSMYVRFYDQVQVFERIKPENQSLGVGFLDNTQDPNAFWMERALADSVWIGVLYRFGVVGVFLVALLYAMFMIKALRVYLRSHDPEASFIALVLVLVLLDAFIESVQNWTFLYPGKMALGFWYFALGAVESNRFRANDEFAENVEEVEEDPATDVPQRLE